MNTVDLQCQNPKATAKVGNFFKLETTRDEGTRQLFEGSTLYVHRVTFAQEIALDILAIDFACLDDSLANVRNPPQQA